MGIDLLEKIAESKVKNKCLHKVFGEIPVQTINWYDGMRKGDTGEYRI